MLVGQVRREGRRRCRRIVELGSGAAAPGGARRAIDRSARPGSWRAFGPRRLRRQSNLAWLPLAVIPTGRRLVPHRASKPPQRPVERRLILIDFWPTREPPAVAPPCPGGPCTASTPDHCRCPASVRLSGEPESGRESLAGAGLGSYTLKRPKRAMVGAWSGLDHRPVHPASCGCQKVGRGC